MNDPTISRRRHGGLLAAGALVVMLSPPLAARAASLLGSAADFAVLGASTVTNAGASTINGDIGASPGATIADTGTLTLTGARHLDDAAAAAAHGDAVTAFNTLAGLATTTDLSGQDLGVVGVLSPGVYTFSSGAQLTGTLTLDFTGHANQAFVFQVASALVTATDARVDVEGGGPDSAIYWQVGSSATLGTGTAFAGNLLADQSITFDTGADILCGRAMTLNAAVTLDASIVSDSCAHGGDYGSGRPDFGSEGFAGLAVPEPAAWAMMLAGLAVIGAFLRVRARSAGGFLIDSRLDGVR